MMPNREEKLHKPDLVCISEDDEPGDSKIVVIDVAVRYEDATHVMNTVAEEKHRKYVGLTETIRTLFARPHAEVIFGSVVVGAKGSLRPGNREFLTHLFGAERKVVNAEISRLAVLGSVKVWHAFIEETIGRRKRK